MSDTPPTDIYGVFCATIDQTSIQRVMNAVSVATQQKTERVHILFQSSGGNVSEGVCLHGFFKNSPIDVLLYNMGSVCSSAAIAYCGAKKRVASKHSTFMLHRTFSNAPLMIAQTVPTLKEILEMDDARILALLKERFRLDPTEWEHLGHGQLWFTAEEALEHGLADEIGEFAPPKGTMIYSF